MKGALLIIHRDTVLFFKSETCKKTDNPVYDLSMRSGNKLIQLLAVIFGTYIIFRYYDNIPVLIIALVMFFGDCYLFLFEDALLCI
jgi:hypothetical protein